MKITVFIIIFIGFFEQISAQDNFKDQEGKPVELYFDRGFVKDSIVIFAKDKLVYGGIIDDKHDACALVLMIGSNSLPKEMNLRILFFVNKNAIHVLTNNDDNYPTYYELIPDILILEFKPKKDGRFVVFDNHLNYTISKTQPFFRWPVQEHN